MIPRPGGKSHCMKLSKRFIILIWKLLYWAASLGHLLWCHILSSPQNRAVKRVYEIPPLSFDYCLCLVIMLAISILLNNAVIFKPIFMSSFVNFPFYSQQETLSSQRQHNHSHYLIITEPHAVICRACSLGNIKFQRWVSQRVPHIITTVQWGCFT